ncbi:MAG: ORF6N domain-containing protein [Planctomycetes bacterium]|nr:ORF6N domain-containing protein [Planctomycetota bacterium]
MPGTHLATLYGIPTKVLMQAVRRNIERFPGDFMIQITEEEVEALKGIFPLESSATCSPEGSCSRSQIVTLDGGILTASWGSAGAPRAACSAGA